MIVVMMLVSAWAALAGAADQRAPAVAVFELGEHCGERHPPQAVSFALTAPENGIEPDHVSLLGPRGPVRHQLTDIELWPETKFVRTARVWTVTDLAPFEVRRFEVVSSESPAGEQNPEQGDVVVRQRDNVVEMGNGSCGFRFLVGAKSFDPPALPADVPGPVRAFRLADGTWFGGSELYGDTRVVRYDAEVLSRGPITGQMRIRYEYEDDTVMTLLATLTWGAPQATWSMEVTPVDLEAAVRQVTEPASVIDPLNPPSGAAANGWRLLMGIDDRALGVRVTPEFGENRWGKHEWVEGRWRDEPVHVKPAEEPAGLLVNLVPWRDWWDSSTLTTLTFLSNGGAAVFAMTAEDAGAWVEPAAEGTWAPWGNRRMRDKWLPVAKDKAGRVFMQISLASGIRRWRCGVPESGPPAALDRLKDMVLAWPEGPDAHPRLYMDRRMLDTARRQRVDEARVRALISEAGEPQLEPHQADNAALGAWLVTGDRRIAERVQLVARLEHHLGLNGNFDRMRGTFLLCGLYDGVLGSDLLGPQARRVARARMARAAYVLGTADTWSMERGFCSGNLGMSVAHILNQGLLGCVLGDHPAATTWVNVGLGMVERSLTDTVGPDGEWPESLANYAHVTVSSLLPLAVAARNGGYRDYVADPRLRKLMLFLAKSYSPPDPRPTSDGTVGVSVLPPVGRGGARGRNGLPGVIARATASTDPDYSSTQQWVWARAGFPRNIPDSRLGGWEHVYLDPSLPSRTPAWSLDVFREAGAILRHAVGTRDEWWTYFMASKIDGYPSENGGLPLVFARGVPIIARFSGGYAEREELFLNRVLPARPRGDNEFRQKNFLHENTPELVAWAGLPQSEYVEGLFPIGRARFTSHEASAHDVMQPLPEWPASPVAAEGDIPWRRQVMLVKEEGTSDAALYVRDTVSGDRPTMWQMWMVSNGISPLGPSSPAARGQTRRPSVSTPSGPTALEGNRFLATGQFDIDTLVFVAEPVNTPCSTLRWGRTYNYSPIAGVREEMDLLHLQRPDDGAYFVAFHPHRRGERMARFESLADGAVIRADHGRRIDYILLADKPIDATADGIRFKSKAALVRWETDGPTVAFSERGGIQLPRLFGKDPLPEPAEVATTGAVSLVMRKERITVALPNAHRGTAVRFACGGTWKLEAAIEGVALIDEGKGWIRLHVPAGVSAVVLTAG